MTDNPKKEPMFTYIPDYCLGDPLNDRLLALVKFEQFVNEDDICPEMLDELVSIQNIAREKKEGRIVIMSDLILQQTKKYMKADDE